MDFKLKEWTGLKCFRVESSDGLLYGIEPSGSIKAGEFLHYSLQCSHSGGYEEYYLLGYNAV
jgi:hypothetical protein